MNKKRKMLSCIMYYDNKIGVLWMTLALKMLLIENEIYKMYTIGEYGHTPLPNDIN